MAAMPVPSARTAGLAIEVAAVWLAMILARGMIGLLRGRRRSGGAVTRARLLTCAGLAGAGDCTPVEPRDGGILDPPGRLRNLRVDVVSTGGASWASQMGWREWYQLRES